MPDLEVFRASLREEDDGKEGGDEHEAAMFPGQVMVLETLPSIEINAVDKEEADLSVGPHLVEMTITNTGDWPIEVGSHYRESKVIETYCNVIRYKVV